MSEYTLLMELKEREPLLRGDGTALPPKVEKDIKTNIRKGARDLEQKWKNAVHLTKKAYDVAGYDIPEMKGDGWTQYEHLIGVAVRELHKSRGSHGDYGSWRSSDPKDYTNGDALPDSAKPLNTLPPENYDK